MNVSFIGSGNLSWHLAQAFEQAGEHICEIYSRDLNKAKNLCQFLYNPKAKNDLDFSKSTATLFILAVSDDAITDVCSQLVLPKNAILTHTSGTRTLNELEGLMQVYHDLRVKCAVFYPLMTFSKEHDFDLRETPICIEATDKTSEELLVDIAQKISKTVYLVSSAERRVLHLGAVFACNFTNHLLALAHEILAEENLEFELLKPLIKETFAKALAVPHPADAQTGPAIRNDHNTIARHLNYLNSNENLKEIYDVMTNSIQKWHE